MDVIIGIDLGTTNSEVAVIRDGRPVVLEEEGELILPSVVGLDPQGRAAGRQPRGNQAMLAPEPHGPFDQAEDGPGGDGPAQRQVVLAPGDLGHHPPDAQAACRESPRPSGEESGHHRPRASSPRASGRRRREAGELAELEVVRIINEPTAAASTYDPHPAEMERLLVYDLGGGTFDVSIAQVEQGVVEILTSHGDTHLGGDDFDQRLLDFVCDKFQTKHGIDLREQPVAKSRLLRAVEDAKKDLSTEATVTLAEEFIAEKNGVPLNLNTEINRQEYEELIDPLIATT